MAGARHSTGRPWWRGGVVYQIYPRSFADSDGDGIGDLDGITERLDHLRGGPRSLGVDAIWLCPIHPSPLADFGYDVSDYHGVDAAFGGMAAFDRLVAAARSRRLKVLMDLVPGHTSIEHPWFRAARSSRDDPHRDWYIWAPPAPDGGPPNNWQSVFGGSAWTLDETTGEYFLHSFYPEQPDLNWRCPALVDAFADVIRFWRARGVAGFRVDAIDRSMKDARQRDNPPTTPNAPSALPARFTEQYHLWNRDRPEVLSVVRALRRAADSAGDAALLLGEAYVPIERLGRYLGERPGDAFDLVFDFGFLFAGWDADRLRMAIESAESLLPDHGWPCWALSNHDNARHATRFGDRSVRAAAVLLLTLRGTPILYMGEEIGMVDVPPPAGVRFDRVGRDAQRSPMQWADGAGGGFTTGVPWLPIGDTARANVEVQAADPRSLLSLYRDLIAERAGSPALLQGSYRGVDLAPGSGALAFLREADVERLLVVVDVAGDGTLLDVPSAARGRVRHRASLRLSTDPDRERGEILDLGRLRIGPNEAVLVEL